MIRLAGGGLEMAFNLEAPLPTVDLFACGKRHREIDIYSAPIILVLASNA